MVEYQYTIVLAYHEFSPFNSLDCWTVSPLVQTAEAGSSCTLPSAFQKLQILCSSSPIFYFYFVNTGWKYILVKICEDLDFVNDLWSRYDHGSQECSPILKMFTYFENVDTTKSI